MSEITGETIVGWRLAYGPADVSFGTRIKDVATLAERGAQFATMIEQQSPGTTPDEAIVEAIECEAHQNPQMGQMIGSLLVWMAVEAFPLEEIARWGGCTLTFKRDPKDGVVGEFTLGKVRYVGCPDEED